jgi:hypothetical protein
MNTFSRFSGALIQGNNELISNNIRHVINLTECDSLTSMQSLSLARKRIKSINFFNDDRLTQIKKIVPSSRTEEQVNQRYIIRESILRNQTRYIKELSSFTDGILFICNKNNVLSPLFILLILSLKRRNDAVVSLLDNPLVVKPTQKQTIEKYLAIYLDIVYNKLNELP